MRANPFLAIGFGDAGDRAQTVRAAAERRVSPELISLLRAQNETVRSPHWGLSPSEARDRNLDQLARGGCAVVATGQQVGLFLGPLYTIYKAASAVAIARDLSRETSVPCIPLFWLQTEDHDFPEVCGCTTPVENGALLELKLNDETDPALARQSLGDRSLGPAVTALVDQLETALAELPHCKEVIESLRTNYRPGSSPGRAFAGVLSTLFADQGLLIFDPRCSTAAQLASPIIERSIVESSRIDALLLERGSALGAAGFKEQIDPRPGSPLAFFHLENERGPRYRLTRCTDGFAIPNSSTVISERELLSIHRAQPLRFSTSALLRPIFQDSLFPTAAYVGGPAEVSYFAQVAPLYTHFGLPMPLIAERAHLKLVPHRIRALLQKLGLQSVDLERPRDELLRQLVVSTGDGPSLSWTTELEDRLQAFAANTKESERAVAKAAARMQASVHRGIEKLARRHQRALLEKDSLLRDRLTRLQNWLRPHSEPQERVFAFPAFAARVGMRGLVELVLQAIGTSVPPVKGGTQMRELDL